MKGKTIPIVLAGVLLAGGCVSSREHKARLADIDAMKSDVESLQRDARRNEAELATANRQLDELRRRSQDFEEDNKNLNSILRAKRDELNRTIAELRAKLANRNAELVAWENRVIELSAKKGRSIAALKKTYDSLVGEMQEEINKGEVTITQLREKLTVNMVESILFDSGSAVIKENGEKVLDRVAGILQNVSDRLIKVEGHTDNVPIGPAIIDRFPTNWELSTARATTVLRNLQERGVDPKLLSAEGYSEYRPVASNETEEGRARNRRIEIVLVPVDVAR